MTPLESVTSTAEEVAFANCVPSELRTGLNTLGVLSVVVVPS